MDGTYTIDNIRPVTYESYNARNIGVIAHELQEHYPFLVNGEKDGSEYQSVNYNGLIGILIREIKEMKQNIKEMKNEIQELKNK